jgi:hypothetical protein
MFQSKKSDITNVHKGGGGDLSSSKRYSGINNNSCFTNPHYIIALAFLLLFSQRFY